MRQGLPGRRISGGTRRECTSAQPVIALNPASNMGLTMSDRLSVHFILPKFKKAYSVEFRLRNSQGETLYKTSLKAEALR